MEDNDSQLHGTFFLVAGPLPLPLPFLSFTRVNVPTEGKVK
jgi:hypothetical protein